MLRGPVPDSPRRHASFGVSRVTAFAGDMTQGFYAFRAEMDSRGNGRASELQSAGALERALRQQALVAETDGGQDNPGQPQKDTTPSTIMKEAAKAKAIGCEALYCDPGWDTNFASKIWDDRATGHAARFRRDAEERLRPQALAPHAAFRLVQPEQLSAGMFPHAPGTATATGIALRRVEAVRRGDGEAPQCPGRRGRRYFMFDGTGYNAEGPCWDPAHGHPLPLTMRGARRRHQLCSRARSTKTIPHVSIEMHDQVMGGAPYRYVPLYYGYGKNALGASPRSASTRLGLRNDVGPDGQPRRRRDASRSITTTSPTRCRSTFTSICATDNENALVFWWNASTVRYLGIGGTHTNPKLTMSHVAAMKTYMRLKPFFTAGTFYGISETVHVHRHPTDNAAVMNCFAIGNADTLKFQFDPTKVGLKADKQYKFTGDDFVKNGESYFGQVPVAADGHTLVEVTEV